MNNNLKVDSPQPAAGAGTGIERGDSIADYVWKHLQHSVAGASFFDQKRLGHIISLGQVKLSTYLLVWSNHLKTTQAENNIA